MGMSTYVIGFKPKDEKYLKMKAVYDACKEAEIACPHDVKQYFGSYGCDESGIVVPDLPIDCQKEHFSQGQQGIEIDIRKLPEDIKIIRFVNAW